MKEEKAEMVEKKEEKEEETKDEDPPPPAEEWWKYKFLLFSVLEREILQRGKVTALVCSPTFMPAMQQTATDNLGHGCLCSEINFPCLEQGIGFNADFHYSWELIHLSLPLLSVEARYFPQTVDFVNLFQVP